MRTQAGGTGDDDRRYARIGHGGVSDAPDITMSGDLSGDICVTLGGSVLLDASVAQADASAVQIGTANFIDPSICWKVIQGIEDYLEEQGIPSVANLVGTLELP